jgi:uncharacterized protein
MKILKLCMVILFALSLPNFSAAKGLPAAAAPNSSSSLVINEVDYDQPGTDTAEFVEIINVSAASIDLDPYALQMVNGAYNPAAEYRSIDLPAYSLAPGEVYVVCANAATLANCDLDVSPDTDLIQNGAPDAVAIILSDVIIDTVSYEGDTNPGATGLLYTEGSGVGLWDDPTQPDRSIARCPNGADNDQNNFDFVYRPATPGLPNDCPLTPNFGACGNPASRLHAIQGSGTASPYVGEQRVVEAVVVGDFQDASTGLGGFFLQEEDAQADADPLTSEGLFVYDAGFGTPVSLGDVVRVLGTVTEFYTLTELSGVTNMAVCSTDAAVTAANISLPVANAGDWERWEGMSVAINQPLYATETYDYGQYGEVMLAVDGRLFAPTQLAQPGAASDAILDLNLRRTIQLDDGSNVQNPLPLPPYLPADGTLRLGDSLPGLAGVLGYSYGSYEIHPTAPVAFTRLNARPAAPVAPAGALKVASFNMLNYFTTLDSGPDICGPNADLECRGADTADEFTRQRDKIIQALAALDADIVGLIEIENNSSAAVQDLVNGLNALLGAGTYAFIDTGTIGTDAIKVALIYKPASLEPLSGYVILDSSVDPRFIDTRNRPSLAQTFFDRTSGGVLTVVVNHFKSKGSACGAGDDDPRQGNCNLTRTQAALALADWLSSGPTAFPEAGTLILGDLNAYALEDPLSALTGAGFTDLQGIYIDSEEAYSYVFEGQAGSLDHALASPGLLSQVQGMAVWHANADEPPALDYNNYNQPLLYQADAYRASDHDPLVVYLELAPANLIYLPSVGR